MIKLPEDTVMRVMRGWNNKKPALNELAQAHPEADLSNKADEIFIKLSNLFVEGASNCPQTRHAVEVEKGLFIREKGRELKETIGLPDTQRFLGRVIGGSVSSFKAATGIQVTVPRTAAMGL